MEKDKNLVLVYPYGIWRNFYIAFYDVFIRDYLFKYLEKVKITFIVKDKIGKLLIEEKFKCFDFNVYVIQETLDIWIRDWAPIVCNNIIVKAKFSPKYLKRAYKYQSVPLDTAGKKIADKLNLKYSEISIVLDGGNFVHNGHGVCIITNRVITENENLSIGEIEKILKESYNLNKVVFVPVEPGDETGHIDGMVRFTDEKTLFIADYPDEYEKGKVFMDNVEILLREKLGPDYKIIRLLNEVPVDLHKALSFPSAVGNHTNFLQIGNKIFMPDFKLKTDEQAYMSLKNNLENHEIIRVNCRELYSIASDGGVLNCISWQY